MKDNILIVGAGVAGLMTAIELSQAGLQVQLFDSGQAGMESSWAGGGILSPIYPWLYPNAVNDLAHWSTQHYPEYFTHLKEQTGIDPQWLNSGHLILGTDFTTPEIQQWATRYAINLQQLDQQQLQAIEPTLNKDFDHALWMPDIWQVRNPRLIQALTAYARKIGISITENTRISRILHNDHQVTGIETSQETIHAKQVLVTAGAWSAQFNLGLAQPDVEPVKGQMIQFLTTPGAIKRITLSDGHYVIPRSDGKVLAGSTLEFTGFDKSTDESTKQSLHDIAAAIYPSLKSTPIINHWAGLRPGNKRQIPFIDEHPEINGLYFNTGHYRNGIVLGLASARLCADIIVGRTPILSTTAYTLTSG